MNRQLRRVGRGVGVALAVLAVFLSVVYLAYGVEGTDPWVVLTGFGVAGVLLALAATLPRGRRQQVAGGLVALGVAVFALAFVARGYGCRGPLARPSGGYGITYVWTTGLLHFGDRLVGGTLRCTADPYESVALLGYLLSTAGGLLAVLGWPDGGALASVLPGESS